MYLQYLESFFRFLDWDQMSFICHIHNYTEYNSSEMHSLHSTHPSAHTPGAVGSPGSSWGFGALLKGLNSVVDNSCRSRDSNPQPRVTSQTLYPLGHDCPLTLIAKGIGTPLLMNRFDYFSNFREYKS